MEEQAQDPKRDELWDILHAGASENRPWAEMRTVVRCHHSANPAPLLIAAIACHVIAARNFVNRSTAVRAFSDARVHIV